MSHSYSSYKNDIILFNSEEYLKNLENSVSHDYFLSFIENYKEIENEDFKKPIFSQTTKFKKIPNTTNKNYKYLKINRDNDDSKNVWVFESPKEESKLISILIKTYLNKISQDTYAKISLEFMNEILLINNNDIFQILTSELLNKCLYDNKYRVLYINFCYKIWTNKQVHYNLVNITNKNNHFYWSWKDDGKDDSDNGPFPSEISAKNDIFNKINFKKYFLNYIQELYNQKDLSFDNLSEEETFIKKKKILLLVELIGIIFLEKYINFDIINIIIIDLLHLNNNFKKIEDIEIEALYTLLKIIKDSKSTLIDLTEYKTIFTDFINIIQKIIDNNEISKRSVFFLNDIISMFYYLNKENNVSNNNNKSNDKDLYSTFIDILNNSNGTVKLIEFYNSINKESCYDIIYKIKQKFISTVKDNKLIIKFLNEINNINLIYTILDNITKNIDDIMLDVPNANEKVLNLISELTKDHPKKNEIIEILKNINSDSDGESSDSD